MTNDKGSTNARKGAGPNSESGEDDILLPLLLRHEGGEGWGEEAVLMSFPLSLTLSPFVAHGERGLARRAVSSRLAVLSRNTHERALEKNFVLRPSAEKSCHWLAAAA